VSDDDAAGYSPLDEDDLDLAPPAAPAAASAPSAPTLLKESTPIPEDDLAESNATLARLSSITDELVAMDKSSAQSMAVLEQLHRERVASIEAGATRRSTRASAVMATPLAGTLDVPMDEAKTDAPASAPTSKTTKDPRPRKRN
jgi:hypothetical protein